MRLYADASVIVAIVANEPASVLVDDHMQRADNLTLVSDLALAECSAALARNGRVRGWTVDDLGRFYRDLDAWTTIFADRIEIAPSDLVDATLFIRRDGIILRAPDAIHIAAARRLDATLITLDRGMVRAAAALGVPSINPAEETADRRTE